MEFALTTVAIVVALVLVTEIGFRFGRVTSARRKYDDSRRAQVSTVQAATLGLLALVLGFVMSMAETRYNRRRVILVDEANAIGTTYLRADFLPEPQSSQTKALLIDYVQSRRDYFRATPEQAPKATERSQQLLTQIWALGASVAKAHPDWDILSTYVQTLNDTIDLEAMRDLAIASRLPGEIHWLLAVVAVTALGITGFSTGLLRNRNAVALYVVPVLIGVAITVILDLDRTRFGHISTGDRPMMRLERALQGQKPLPSPAH